MSICDWVKLRSARVTPALSIQIQWSRPGRCGKEAEWKAEAKIKNTAAWSAHLPPLTARDFDTGYICSLTVLSIYETPDKVRAFAEGLMKWNITKHKGLVCSYTVASTIRLPLTLAFLTEICHSFINEMFEYDQVSMSWNDSWDIFDVFRLHKRPRLRRIPFWKYEISMFSS